jgi:hypothetical protein
LHPANGDHSIWEQQLSYVLLSEKQGMKNPFLSLDKPILAHPLSRCASRGLYTRFAMASTLRTDNFENIIELMKNTKEMFDNASKIDVSKIDQLDSMKVWWRDKEIIERGNFFFRYEYDASDAKWVLKEISRIEKDI